MEKTRTCKQCKFSKPIERYAPYSGNRGRRRICYDCVNVERRNKWAETKHTQEEREKANNRVKEWYKKNKEKAKKRIKAFYKSEHGKALRKIQREEYTKNNPAWWRWKKKRDKSIRRQRESETKLDLSSIVLLEQHNLKFFNSNEFHCEYCSSALGINYELEHIIPLSRGGTNFLTNLAISCSCCNSYSNKGTKLLEEWRPELLSYIKDRNRQWKVKSLKKTS